MEQKIKEIIARLERADYQYAEAEKIIREIKLEFTQDEIDTLISDYRNRSRIILESNNRDFLDVVDHIINTLDND
ncbi:MAG: hypothetical protein AAGF85_19960 [Bacteroidota bacterium]